MKKDPCWTGYKQVGMKKKGKKMVPNCIPEEAPSMNTGAIPDPKSTVQGPRSVQDRRRKKNSPDPFPVLLKRFRQYIQDKGI